MSARCLLKAAAKAEGRTRYISDKPCPKGHGFERLTTGGCCIVCAREIQRRHYTRHQPVEREKARKAQAIKRANDPRGERQRQVRARLRITYGLTEQQYATMFEAQKGCCAVCDSPIVSRLDETRELYTGHGCPKNNVSRVDHCHKTGRVRGLLCGNCNHALGKFQESEKILLQAVRYLRESATAQAKPVAERESASEIEPAMGPRIERSRGNRRDDLSPFLN